MFSSITPSFLLLFTDMTGFDKKGTPKEREKLQLTEVGKKIQKQLEEIEAKIKEIKKPIIL